MPPQRPSRDPIDEAAQQWRRHGWGEAATGMATATSVIRVAQIINQRAEQALSPFSITFPRFEVLALLMFSRAGALPMSKVSSRLQVHPASITHSVARLEKDGLVQRTPDPDDGRGTLVSITDQGIALVSAAVPALNGVFTGLELEDESLEQLYGLLHQFRSAAGDFGVD